MLPTKRETVVRLMIVCLPIALMAIVLLGRAGYLASNQQSQDRTKLILMTRTPDSIIRLEEQSKELARVAANIDQHSLSEIRTLLDKTASTAGYATREIQAQQDAWRDIQTRNRVDADTYKRIQTDLSGVTKMQEEEIVRLNDLLDRAKAEPLAISILAFVVTFILGILSSLISSQLYDIWKDRKKADPE